MKKRPKSDDGLANTGKPGDPAKKENPDTRLDQLQPADRKGSRKDDEHPALDTTKEAGQGTG